MTYRSDIYTINNHLSLKGFREGDIVWESSLVIAIRDARKATGRNEETGIPDNLTSCGYQGSWLGAIGYLTVLDLIGKTYKPKNQPDLIKTSNTIDKALQYFGNVTYKDASAIYALRCSLMHDYNLINFDKKDRNEFNHVFEVDVSGPLVTHRVSESVIFELPMKKHSITKVNIKALCDKVEEIYSYLIQLNIVEGLEFKENAEVLRKYFCRH